MSHFESRSTHMLASGRPHHGAGQAAARRGRMAAVVEALLFPSCLLLLLTALTFGGGTRAGFIGDAIIQFVALPCLAIIAVSLVQRDGSGIRLWEYCLVLLTIAIPIWQQWPFPPSVWAHFPAQQLRLDALNLLGQGSQSLTLSLTPDSTRLAALSLIPPIGLYLGIRQLNAVQRNRCVMAIAGFGLLSVFLGLAQLAGGPASTLRFYTVTNPSDAVGFFANRNHLAALLYIAFMLSAAWIIDSLLAISTTNVHGTSRQRLLIILAVCFTVAFLLGSAQILTRSRAGVGITMLGVVGIGLVAFADRRNQWRGSSLIVLGILVAGAFLFATQTGLNSFLERVRFDPLHDTRLTVWNTTTAAIRDFWPLGSGIGSFERVYPLYEKTTDLLANVFINRAHNDYTELMLEAGLPATIVFVFFSVWLIVCSVSLSKKVESNNNFLSLLVRRLAFLAVVCLLIHSFVDYPLRTSALMSVFSVLLAIVAPLKQTSERVVTNEVS